MNPLDAGRANIGHRVSAQDHRLAAALNAGQRRSPPCNATCRQPSPNYYCFYNCEGERQTFACRLLMTINAGLPPSLSCEGPPPSSVLLLLCCMVWRGTRKRRHQGGITAQWDDRPTLRGDRPTLWDSRPTLCEGRPALKDAIWRHGALWDGRATLWDGRPTLWDGITVSLPPASEGLPPSNAN